MEEYEATRKAATQCSSDRREVVRAYAALTVGELRHAEWKEIDLEKGEWKISAAKMKMRTTHIVPLADQAVRILEEIKPLTGQGQ